jgi:hypothetical protein
MHFSGWNCIPHIFSQAASKNGSEISLYGTGPDKPEKRLATLKKYKKEQQDSFSTITQTEHLDVLLKW